MLRLMQSNNLNSYYPRVIVQLKLSSLCCTVENLSRLLCTQGRKKKSIDLNQLCRPESLSDLQEEQFPIKNNNANFIT